MRERENTTISGIGKMMSNEVGIGRYGAYLANDANYDYYIVNWTSKTWESQTDRKYTLGQEEFTVKKGDMICR